MDDPVTNLLLVEDSPEYVSLVCRMLGDLPGMEFNVSVVGSISEAREQLGGGPVDLVIMDLTLADSDGANTLQALRDFSGELPVIVLTGLDDDDLAIQALKNGAEDYLVKGQVNRQLLIRSVRYAIEGKSVERELARARIDLERRVAERTAELQKTNARLEKEIGDRRQAEEALRESNGQLAEALGRLRESQEHVIQRERLHALGRMASGIAHDFNNALAPILGFSEMILLKPEVLHDPKRVRNYVEMIHNAAKESAAVAGRLRDFYRYREDSEAFGPVSLAELIPQVIAFTQPKWKDQALASGTTVTIRTDLQNVPSVLGNESELREMLANIVFNAVDAISGAGVIEFRCYLHGDRAIVEVSDTGCGMDEEICDRCLEPFFSTKAEHGTGLGLGIVYGIVRRHDGDISIDSEPGQGTTVTISLPLYEDPMPEPAKEVPAPEAQLRILVVEDEPLVREVVSVYLTEDNHQVETAENGREGLEKFRACQYDLVLTDRAMPEMNGDQLAVEIKAIKPDQPVVLLTGFGDLMTGAGEKPDGVDVVVSKPFTLSTLREAISEGLRRGAGG